MKKRYGTGPLPLACCLSRSPLPRFVDAVRVSDRKSIVKGIEKDRCLVLYNGEVPTRFTRSRASAIWFAKAVRIRSCS